MDFENNNKNNSTVELTAQLAQEIYNFIKICGNADKAFKSNINSYDYSNIQSVDYEGDIIRNKIRFAFVEKDDEDEYIYSTEEELLSSIESDLLDVEVVYDDFMNGLSFEEYRNRLNQIDKNE